MGSIDTTNHLNILLVSPMSGVLKFVMYGEDGIAVILELDLVIVADNEERLTSLDW